MRCPSETSNWQNGTSKPRSGVLVNQFSISLAKTPFELLPFDNVVESLLAIGSRGARGELLVRGRVHQKSEALGNLTAFKIQVRSLQDIQQGFFGGRHAR